MLNELKAILITTAQAGETITYGALAKQTHLQPPHTIQQVAGLLEQLMRLQAEMDEPQLASCVVSRMRAGLPAPGFFLLVRTLGLYDGPDSGEDARTFVAVERERCRQFRVWSNS